MDIACTCPLCHGTKVIEVTDGSWRMYAEGAFAQDAFSYLSVDDRERLMTGICPACWERMHERTEDGDDE